MPSKLTINNSDRDRDLACLVNDTILLVPEHWMNLLGPVEITIEKKPLNEVLDLTEFYRRHHGYSVDWEQVLLVCPLAGDDIALRENQNSVPIYVRRPDDCPIELIFERVRRGLISQLGYIIFWRTSPKVWNAMKKLAVGGLPQNNERFAQGHFCNAFSESLLEPKTQEAISHTNWKFMRELDAAIQIDV